MSEEKKGSPPDYKNGSVAIWVKKDKNGKTYLSVCLFEQINVNCWKYEPPKIEKPDVNDL